MLGVPSTGASQVALVAKNLPASAGDTRDLGSIPGSGRSPQEGKGSLLQYSCLEVPMDRGVWWATVRGVSQSWTDVTKHIPPLPTMGLNLSDKWCVLVQLLKSSFQLTFTLFSWQIDILDYGMLVPASCWFGFGKVCSFVPNAVLLPSFDCFLLLSPLIFYKEWKTGKLKCPYEWSKAGTSSTIETKIETI